MVAKQFPMEMDYSLAELWYVSWRMIIWTVSAMAMDEKRDGIQVGETGSFRGFVVLYLF